MRTYFVFLALIMTAGSVLAQEPKVRTSLATKGDLWVGQRMTLVVELLAPGFFSGAPNFDLPDPQGILLLPPASSPVVGSEQIDGTSYTVQRHELYVFARRAGAQTIPPLTVRFGFKRQPLDKEVATATVKTEAIPFTTKSPPGAEKLGAIISARELTVVETWKPEPGKAKAGDAYTRTITYAAPDVPAMAFPPFPVGKIDGVGIYPKSPQVLDQSERGQMHGQRIDTITYVCQRPGEFIIPAARMSWFNIDAQKVQVIEFPARTFHVSADGAMASGMRAEPSHSPTPSWRTIAIASSLILCGLVLFHSRSRWIAALRPVHLMPLNPVTKPGSS